MCKTNLTVVLTLKGREQYTYRWMQYMDAISFPYKIIIADGGSSRTLQNHLQDNNSYKNIDYEYIRYPIDETIDVYYDKLIDVVSKVKSKYLLMADNDDFFIVDKVEEMLSFMDCNNDYVGIRGEVVNLKIYPFCFFGFGCNGGDSYSAIRNESKSIDDAIAIDRVRSLCKDMSKHDYYMNWYCIYRTDEISDVINNVLSMPVRSPLYVEFMTHILVVIKGKIKITDSLFYVRQSGTSEFGDALIESGSVVEDFLIKNSLSDFKGALDGFSGFAEHEKNEALKAIACWLEVYIYNIHWSKMRWKYSVFYKSYRVFYSIPYVGSRLCYLADILYVNLRGVMGGIRRRRILRLKNIAPHMKI